MRSIEVQIACLAEKYLPLAVSILKEAIRIPIDHLEDDPECGLSNHEGPRLAYLKQVIQEIGAVFDSADCDYDAFGNLVWTLEDRHDGMSSSEKKIIYFDGHTDTVKALGDQWRDKIGEGMSAYDGLLDGQEINREFLREELGYIPSEEEWENLLFGRGSADQLGGVVAQIIASKILVELAPQGVLRGVIVRSYATVAEEDNDGGGPMFLVREVLPGAGQERIPDVVILTEGTGDAQKGALGIYRGQRGRMQIEVTVEGRSCHGSMPWEGLNPLEFGAAILVEARQNFEQGQGFLDHEFLGAGTRTASWAELATPSDCAVPDRFVFRFDRRLTVGETPEQAVAHVAELKSVAVARDAGLRVDVSIPVYEKPSWKGYRLNNPQVYMGWETPADHPAIVSAVEAYSDVVTPNVDEGEGGGMRKAPRVSRWIFSTDGVGFPVPVEGSGLDVDSSKSWVTAGEFMHPAMFGLGPGIEQNTHKIGECLDVRELQHAIAFMAAYPRVFAGKGK